MIPHMECSLYFLVGVGAGAGGVPVVPFGASAAGSAGSASESMPVSSSMSGDWYGIAGESTISLPALDEPQAVIDARARNRSEARSSIGADANTGARWTEALEAAVMTRDYRPVPDRLAVRRWRRVVVAKAPTAGVGNRTVSDPDPQHTLGVHRDVLDPALPLVVDEPQLGADHRGTGVGLAS
jgi:hypothetical protein